MRINRIIDAVKSGDANTSSRLLMAHIADMRFTWVYTHNRFTVLKQQLADLVKQHGEFINGLPCAREVHKALSLEAKPSGLLYA